MKELGIERMINFKKMPYIISAFAIIGIVLIFFYVYYNYHSMVIKDDMNIYFDNGRNTTYIRLSQDGSYEIYCGASFYTEIDEELSSMEDGTGIPTIFFDVRKRKLPEKVCDRIFLLGDDLQKSYDSVDSSFRDNNYIVIRIEKKRYYCSLNADDTIYKEKLLMIYNTFMDNVPSFRWNTDYTRQYDDNGKIVPVYDDFFQLK